MFFSTLGIAIREIRANLLRSFLTTLGIIIGVGAVIIVVSLGQGATMQVQNDLSSLGSNLIALIPGAENQGSANRLVTMFTQDDVDAIREQVPTISMATGVLTQVATLVYGNENYYSSVRGTDNDYLTIRNLDVVRVGVLPAASCAAVALSVFWGRPRGESCSGRKTPSVRKFA